MVVSTEAEEMGADGMASLREAAVRSKPRERVGHTEPRVAH